VDLHQAHLGGLLHPGALLAHLLSAGEDPHPATGYEVLAGLLKGLQPSVLVVVALVVQVSGDD
jgi:ABC-type uncharacterized transport system permease subunit